MGEGMKDYKLTPECSRIGEEGIGILKTIHELRFAPFWGNYSMMRDSLFELKKRVKEWDIAKEDKKIIYSHFSDFWDAAKEGKWGEARRHSEELDREVVKATLNSPIACDMGRYPYEKREPAERMVRECETILHPKKG